MSGSTWTWIGGAINVDSPNDWTLTAGPGNPTGIPEAGDTAINNGTLVGYGLIAVALINNGTVEATNSNVAGPATGRGLEIRGSVSGTGSMTIAPGGTLHIEGAGQSIPFSPRGVDVTRRDAPRGVRAVEQSYDASTFHITADRHGATATTFV